jgi:hypothetical protein
LLAFDGATLVELRIGHFQVGSIRERDGEEAVRAVDRDANGLEPQGADDLERRVGLLDADQELQREARGSNGRLRMREGRIGTSKIELAGDHIGLGGRTVLESGRIGGE